MKGVYHFRQAGAVMKTDGRRMAKDVPRIGVENLSGDEVMRMKSFERSTTGVKCIKSPDTQIS